MSPPVAPFARDVDLLRDILVWMENGAARGERPSSGDDKQFAYHCWILKESNLIDATIATFPGETGMKEFHRAYVRAILPAGHDFLQVCRSAGAWNKIKTAMAERGVPLVFELILGVAKGYAKQQGLPIE